MALPSLSSHLFQKKRHRLLHFSVTFFLFAFVSTLQTAWYYHILDLHVSFRTLVFIALFSFLLSLLVYMNSSKIWKSVLSIGIGALSIFHLINFVYINIFLGFFSFNTSGSIHMPTMLVTIKEFYAVVPWHIYAVTFLYLIVHMIVIFASHRKTSVTDSILFEKDMHEQRAILYSYKIFIFTSQIVLVTLFLGAGLYLQDRYEQQPRHEWWKYNYNVSDKGVYGHLFSMVDDLMNPQDIILGEVTIAQDQEPETAETATSTEEIVEEKEKTPLMIIKDYIHKLRTHKDDIDIELPEFDQPMHIVHYQLESMPLWGIAHEPSAAPFLRELMSRYISTDQFFANGCHTIDAEYATLCSALPDSAHPIPEVAADNDYSCLPQLLKDDYGYRTAVIHSNTPDFWNREVLDPKWGFADLLFAPEYFDWFKMDDSVALTHAVDYLKHSEKPTFVEVIGVSSHSVHTYDDLMGIGERSGGISMDLYEGSLDPDIASRIEITDEHAEMYLSYIVNVDRALRNFFDDLEKNNLLDNTIVVITNDHRYYNFSGGDARAFNLYNQQPFVLYVPGMEQVRLPLVASLIDVAPTLLHLLNGTTQHTPDNFVGTSLFDDAHPNSALSSCSNMINYISHDEIIIGDILAEQYAYLKTDKDSHVLTPALKQVLQYIVDMNDMLITENKLY